MAVGQPRWEVMSNFMHLPAVQSLVAAPVAGGVYYRAYSLARAGPE